MTNERTERAGERAPLPLYCLDIACFVNYFKKQVTHSMYIGGVFHYITHYNSYVYVLHSMYICSYLLHCMYLCVHVCMYVLHSMYVCMYILHCMYVCMYYTICMYV